MATASPASSSRLAALIGAPSSNKARPLHASPLGSPLWISSWIGLYVLGIGLCILSIGLYILSPVGSLRAWNTCISMSRAANHISHTYSSIQEKGDGDAIMLFIVSGMSI
jgi:hypothetical protein